MGKTHNRYYIVQSKTLHFTNYFFQNLRCFYALLISSSWIQRVMEYFNIFAKEIKRGFYRHYFGFM